MFYSNNLEKFFTKTFVSSIVSGEIMAQAFPSGIPFGGYTNPIVPGGYAVVGQ